MEKTRICFNMVLVVPAMTMKTFWDSSVWRKFSRRFGVDKMETSSLWTTFHSGSVEERWDNIDRSILHSSFVFPWTMIYFLAVLLWQTIWLVLIQPLGLREAKCQVKEYQLIYFLLGIITVLIWLTIWPVLFQPLGLGKAKYERYLFQWRELEKNILIRSFWKAKKCHF